MKVLITGGDGFIARSLKEAFEKDYQVFNANRECLDLLDGRNVRAFVKDGGFDVVIHTATYDAAPSFSTRDPQKVLEMNLRIFFNLVRCEDYFQKMIYFGSGAEFGREHWKPAMREDYFDTHVPGDQYGFSKYIMSRHAQRSGKIYNLRLFGVFGKYDDWRYRFIPNLCCRAVFDMPLTIRRNAIFDFMYIDDLTRIVDWFMYHQPSQNVFNVCSGRAYQLAELADLIVAVSGKKLSIDIATPGAGKEYSGDNSRLMRELGGHDFLPIKQAIRALYGWYEQHARLINKKLL